MKPTSPLASVFAPSFTNQLTNTNNSKTKKESINPAATIISSSPMTIQSKSWTTTGPQPQPQLVKPRKHKSRKHKSKKHQRKKTIQYGTLAARLTEFKQCRRIFMRAVEELYGSQVMNCALVSNSLAAIFNKTNDPEQLRKCLQTLRQSSAELPNENDILKQMDAICMAELHPPKKPSRKRSGHEANLGIQQPSKKVKVNHDKHDSDEFAADENDCVTSEPPTNPFARFPFPGVGTDAAKLDETSGEAQVAVADEEDEIVGEPDSYDVIGNNWDGCDAGDFGPETDDDDADDYQSLAGRGQSYDDELARQLYLSWGRKQFGLSSPRPRKNRLSWVGTLPV